MNRRNFLRNTSLMLSAYGLSQTFKIDLIEKLSREILPQAAAAENTPPRRVLEICLRSGIPTMIIGTGEEFTALSAPRYSNFSYAGNQITKAQGTSNLYLNPDSVGLMAHASNIAITQGIRSEGGHTEMFNIREGGAGMRKVTPIIELANLNTTASIIHGTQWLRNMNNPEVQNSVGSYKNLVSTNAASFTNLFKQARLQFTGDELKKVLRAAERLSQRQAAQLEAQMKNAQGNVATYSQSLKMMNTDFSKLLDITTMDSRLSKNLGHGYAREAIAYSLKAFEHNLQNSAMVSINAGDWHGVQQPGDASGLARDISTILAATIEHMKKTPDSAAGAGKTLWDTTTIVMGSEFTRGVSKFGRDNSDGGTQGFILAGKNIQGNYYGGFSLQDSAGGANGVTFGIDPISGNVTPNTLNTTEQAYMTVKKAVGLEVSPSDAVKVLKPMLKA